MKKTRLCTAIIFTLFALPTFAADLVLRNGDVYTVDAARRWASAVAVSGNKIVYVGSEEGIDTHIEAKTRVIDLQGRMLLPGFNDSHLHTLSGGTSLGELALDGIYDREEIFHRVRTYIEANQDLPWIIGGGWIEAPFLPEGVPNRQMLDRIELERPIFINNASGHQAWVNTKALELAGITADTPDPENGRIDREDSGAPSGSLHESAMELVSKHIPAKSALDYRNAVELALDAMASYGITSIMDAGSRPEAERALSSLYDEGAMTVRAVLCQSHDAERDDEEQIAEFTERRASLAYEDLRASCVKIMLDGIIEHHTSALLEPYRDKPDSRGMIFIQPERLQPLVQKLDKEGFQIHIHSIADRSTREALNALENAVKVNGYRDARPTQAHLQLVNPADIPRFRKLGVIPNSTPVWARLDFWEMMAIDVLGSERGEQLILLQDYIRHGATLVWGTDWPVTTLSPLDGIETAVTRRHLGGINPGSGAVDETWMPTQTLGLDQAIASYTINGAYLMHSEDRRGSIETGKLADLVVLEQNLFEVPPLEIHQVKVDLTIFDGRIIYLREED
jgi:predicted amidohydrolase YtcJ